MIDAGKFATPTTPTPFNDGQQSFLRFGLDAKNAAAELRRLADAIEQKLILIQSVQTGTVADLHDYVLQAIMITFAEREVIEARDEAVVAAALYGPGSQFPVAVAEA
jgi:hypothetical protein